MMLRKIGNLSSNLSYVVIKWRWMIDIMVGVVLWSDCWIGWMKDKFLFDVYLGVCWLFLKLKGFDE